MPEYRYNTRSKTNNHHIDHKKTVGEELFEVYLRRSKPEGDESNNEGHIKNRERVKSIGEELFDIHLKRSRGIELDGDVDPSMESQQKVIQGK